jgi:hypothetical protein
MFNRIKIDLLIFKIIIYLYYKMFLSKNEKNNIINIISLYFLKDIAKIIFNYYYDEIIYSTNKSFAAKTINGDLLIWGDCIYEYTKFTGNVVSIKSFTNAFIINFKNNNNDIIFCNSKDIPINNLNVDHIYSTLFGISHAIKLKNGDVITYGNKHYGGEINFELKNVDTIQSTNTAFAAKLKNGNVVVWGKNSCADINNIEDKLKNVNKIYSTILAYAAKLYNGNVITWGYSDYGGDCSSVQHLLKNVDTIYSTERAFAAKLKNGNIITWGDKQYGGDCSSIQHLLDNVDTIYSTLSAFAAKLKNGNIITWGDNKYGGDSSAIKHLLEDVEYIVSTSSTFIAHLKNKNVISWGEYNNKLENVKQIYITKDAFTVKYINNEIESFGNKYYGGDLSSIKHLLKNVDRIYSNNFAFAAVLDNGEIITWGDKIYGGKLNNSLLYK